MRRNGRQQLLLAINQVTSIEASVLEAVAVGDGVRWAGLDAVSTKDTSIVIDVINPGIALPPLTRSSFVFSAASMKMQFEGQAAAQRKQATHFSRPFSSRCRTWTPR